MRIQKPIRGQLPDLTGIFGRGLILDLPFNELHGDTAHDRSRHGHDGTLKGNVAWVGGGLDFPGAAGDYIEIADHADFSPALTPFSISAVINMDDATEFMIASKGFVGTGFEWDLRIKNTDHLRFILWDSSEVAALSVKYNTVMTGYQNQDIHILATYNGGVAASSANLHLNGVHLTDVTTAAAGFLGVENQAHKIWIGRYEDTYANGRIKSLMMWNRELQVDEARRLNELMYPLDEN